MNIWNTFWGFWRDVWYLLLSYWDDAACYTWDNARIRRFIRGALISFGICIAIMILGFLLKLKVLVVVASALAAIIAFAAGKALRIIIKALIKLVALGENAIKEAICRIVNIPVAGKIVRPFGDISNWTATELSHALQETLKSIKASLSFIVTISMTLAFTGALTAIRGVGYYSLNDLMVIGAAALFTFLFFVYIGKKVKAIGYLMYGVWLYFFIGGWLFPIQVQGILDWAESKTIRRAVIATDSNWRGQLVVVPARTPLYREGFGQFSFIGRMTDKEVSARVIGRTNDPDSKEPMYEVKLPLSGFDNLYPGGETHFVPGSLVRPVQSTSAPSAKAHTAEYNLPGKVLNINLQSEEIYTIDQVVEGQEWRYLSFNGSFSHRVDKGDGKACWKLVDNNQPWHAGVNGQLQVKAGNTPVTLTVNVL